MEKLLRLLSSHVFLSQEDLDDIAANVGFDLFSRSKNWIGDPVDLSADMYIADYVKPV